MPEASEDQTQAKPLKPWLWTKETAALARERKRQLREARRAQAPLLRAREREASALDQYQPLVPVLDDASRELLPKILSDEIAWRSELLSAIRRSEQALLRAINESLYDQTKQTLPQLATALVKVVEMSERIVERTKALDLTGQSTSQVSGLFAKYAVLRRELQARGLMDEHGRLKTPAGESAEAEAADAESPTPHDDASVHAGAPPAGEEGV